MALSASCSGAVPRAQRRAICAPGLAVFLASRASPSWPPRGRSRRLWSCARQRSPQAWQRWPLTLRRPRWRWIPCVACDARRASAAGRSIDDYLAAVSNKTATFFQKVGNDGLPVVVNREATQRVLRVLGTSQGDGQLMLLTGPCSTGKSLLLRKMVAELKAQKRRVVIFDGRLHGTDLVRGIMSYLTRDEALLEAVIAHAPHAAAADIAALAAELGEWSGLAAPSLPSKVRWFLDTIIKASRGLEEPEVPRLNELLGAFFSACASRGEYPVIVIDEANKVLAACDDAAKQRTLRLLNLLTRTSKVMREASVVLATTNHRLLLRLQAMGYNTHHIRRTIVAEEVQPAVMKQLLMREWGCGEHLANALLSLYGGHVFYASETVNRLATATDRGNRSARDPHLCPYGLSRRCHFH